MQRTFPKLKRERRLVWLEEIAKTKIQELEVVLSVWRNLSCLLNKLDVFGQVYKNQSVQVPVCLPKTFNSNLALILQMMDAVRKFWTRRWHDQTYILLYSSWQHVEEEIEEGTFKVRTTVDKEAIAVIYTIHDQSLVTNWRKVMRDRCWFDSHISGLRNCVPLTKTENKRQNLSNEWKT